MTIFFGILFLVSIIFTIFNPFIGLYALTVSLYIKIGLFSGLLAKLRPTFFLGILTFIMSFIYLRKKGGLVFFRSPQSKYFILLGIILCLSLTTSIWRSNTLSFIINFFKIYIAYFLVINLITTVRQYQSIISAMVLSMGFICILSVQQYMGGRMQGPYEGMLIGDPNDLSLAVIMVIPFVYFNLFRKNIFIKKIISLGILALFLWVIILTQSRGGFTGFATMAIIFWIRSKSKLKLTIIGILVLAIGWQIAPQSFKNRMMSINTAAEEDAAAISRLDSWKAGINMMKSRAFGVGGANFGEGFVKYRPPGAIDVSGMRRASHNMFVQIGGEMGFIGLFVFLMMIFSSFKSLNIIKKQLSKKTDVQSREILLLVEGTFLSLVGYCASGFFLSQGYNFLLYYLIAFSEVLIFLSNEKTNKNSINVNTISQS